MKSLEKISEKSFVSMNKQMLNSFKGGESSNRTMHKCVESTNGGHDTLTTVTYDGSWSDNDGYCIYENHLS